MVLLSVLGTFSIRQALQMLNLPRLPADLLSLLNNRSFIRYHALEKTYEFHHLLTVFLQSKFDELPDLQQVLAWRRAGDCCASVCDCVRASEFYAMAEDFISILDLPFSIIDLTELVRTNPDTVVRPLLTHCPRSVLLRHSEIIMKIALELFLYGKEELFDQYYELIKESCRFAFRHNPARYRRFRKELAMLEFFMAFNHIGEMCSAHQRAHVFLSSSVSCLISIRDTWTFGIPSVLCMFWRESGMLREECSQLADEMPVYLSLTGGHGSGADASMSAEIFLNCGDTKNAETAGQTALYLAGRKNQNSIAFCAWLTLAQAALLGNNPAGFQEATDAMKQLSLNGDEPRCYTTYELAMGFLNMVLDRPDQIPSWIRDPHGIENRLYTYAIPFFHILYGWYLMKFASEEQFHGIVQSLDNEAAKQHMLLPKLYYLLFSAVKKDRCSRRLEAVADLEEALDLTLPDRVYLPFAEHFPGLEPLLALVRTGSPVRADEIRIVCTLGRKLWQNIRRLKSSRPDGELPLTNREQEISGLLRQGLTAKQIAVRLDISPNTVRTIMKSIYQKLGIHSKTELLMMPPEKIP